jgi:hypothetical protein
MPLAAELSPIIQRLEDHMDEETLVTRVRAEFVESPGLSLTIAQAARLWGLDLADCRRVADRLVAGRFLRWTPAGALRRADQ